MGIRIFAAAALGKDLYTPLADCYPSGSVEEEKMSESAKSSPKSLEVGVAVHRYETEGLSLAKAADLAGLSWVRMREVLLERGIQPRLGPETLEEAQDEVRVLGDYLANRK